MAIHIKHQERAIATERTHDIHARFAHVELLLRNLTRRSTSYTEYDLVDNIKHSMMVIAMKDKVCETNEIFIDNTITEFYHAMNELININISVEWDLFYIKLFVEDFYINPIHEDSSDSE